MILSANHLAQTPQGIPLLEKCQPMQSAEQADERKVSWPLWTTPSFHKLQQCCHHWIMHNVSLFSLSAVLPMHYRHAFDIREGWEILRFKHFTSGM